MKKILVLILSLLSLGLNVFAQQGVVKLRGTRLTYPLVKHWISEFNKEYPHIKVVIAPTSPADSIDFTIAAYAIDENKLTDRQAIAVTRYVQLPIVNENRPDLAALQAKGVTDKDLNALFFSEKAPSFTTSTTSSATPLSLYVRDKPVCAVQAFAGHFGSDPTKINGKGVNGDDADLATAVRNDINGVSFNNLGFIYDTKSRKISEGLAIVPLDLNENGKVDADEQIYSSLDDVIGFIEKTHHPKFVNEEVNVLFNKTSRNQSAGIFLQWVLNKGQQFNHQLGFLNLDEKFLADQRLLATSSFKVSSTSACEGADGIMGKRKTRTASN